MTTLKVTVKRPKSDGLYTVYIRVTHARKSVYINTNKVVDAAHISDSGEPTDPVVKEHCSRLVREYMDRLNRLGREGSAGVFARDQSRCLLQRICPGVYPEDGQ